MRTFRDRAIVLRTHKLGEADRIITLLCAEHGQLRAVGHGVRKTSSRIGARLEPFNVIDVQIRRSTRSDLHSISQVETIAALGPTLAADYGVYTGACLMAETVEKLTRDDPSAWNTYQLTLGALQALSRRRHRPSLIVDSFLLRVFAISGWAPSAGDCAICGADGPHELFSIVGGGAVCPACAPAGARRLDVEAMNLIGALLTGDWGHADMASESARAQASRHIRDFAQWHAEKRLKSLPLLELV